MNAYCDCRPIGDQYLYVVVVWKIHIGLCYECVLLVDCWVRVEGSDKDLM